MHVGLSELIVKNSGKSPFLKSTFLIYITMYLNVDVRQFQAVTATLPETASHPRSNTL